MYWATSDEKNFMVILHNFARADLYPGRRKSYEGVPGPSGLCSGFAPADIFSRSFSPVVPCQICDPVVCMKDTRSANWKRQGDNENSFEELCCISWKCCPATTCPLDSACFTAPPDAAHAAMPGPP